MAEYSTDSQKQGLGTWLPMAGMAAAVGLLLFGQSDEFQSQLSGASYDIEQLELQVQQLLLQGQADQAIALLQDAIESAPYQSSLYSLMAWTLLNIGQAGSGFSYAQKAIELASVPLEYAQGYYMAGSVYIQTRNWDDGIIALRTCLNFLNNQHTWLCSQGNYLLGYCYYAKRSYQDAAKYFLPALQLNPQNLEAASCLGDTYLQLGEYGKAINYYHYALQLLAARQDMDLEPKSIWISNQYLNIGVSFYDLDNLTESYRYFEAAHNAYQFNPYALVNLAELSARNGNRSDMSLYLEQVIPCLRNTSYFPEATSLIGRLCTHSGFSHYRDKVLGLLMRQNLISPRDYEHALQDWEKQKSAASSKTFNIWGSTIGVMNDGSQIEGDQTGFQRR